MSKYLAVLAVALACAVPAVAGVQMHPIANDGDGKGPLPPCVENSMCGLNGRTCVGSSNGSGCCPNRNGTCGTANPLAVSLDGGIVVGWAMIHYVEEGTREAFVGDVAVEDILRDPELMPFDREARGYWQIGIHVLQVYGQPRVLEDGDVVERYDFLNRYADRWELIPAEDIGHRRFVPRKD